MLIERALYTSCLAVTRRVPVHSSSSIFVGLLSDVQAAEDESVFLLHACAHNPTGIDPTQDQWAELSKLMKTKKHTAFFDCAYQVTSHSAPILSLLACITTKTMFCWKLLSVFTNIV